MLWYFFGRHSSVEWCVFWSQVFLVSSIRPFLSKQCTGSEPLNAQTPPSLPSSATDNACYVHSGHYRINWWTAMLGSIRK